MGVRLGLVVLALALPVSSPAQPAANTATPVPGKGTISVTRLKVCGKARHAFEKAQVALNEHHDAEASKQVETALALAPDYPDALTLRAFLDLNAGSTESAIRDLDHAVRSDAGFGLAYLVIASVFNRQGRFDDAIRSLDRASLLEPNSWQCAFEMSKSWLGKQEYSRALEQVNRAASLGGDRRMNASIHFVRGYALVGLKHLGEAASELEAYLSAEPNGSFAGTARATLTQIRTAASLVDMPMLSEK
jgi:tetratricopeptide (TPR) repeat protein